MLIPRQASERIRELLTQYAVVTVVGPRQSGKTTLTRQIAPSLPYVNLEDLRHREFALSDPVAFLDKYKDGAIFDEIQRCPDLSSQIQVRVDESKKKGLFLLTGSHQFEVMEKVSQSLAGRTSMFRLLPLSLKELIDAGKFRNSNELIFRGCYPQLHTETIDPTSFYQDYVSTYLERDLRQLSEIRNLSSFRRFLKLCAGRVGQILDLQELGTSSGVSQTTAKAWMSLLEASYVVFLLPPYFANIGKRLVKRPKLYFYDVGLASYLLDLTQLSHLELHPLRGALFENLVVTEALKARLNKHAPVNLYFYRDQSKNEVDLLNTEGSQVTLTEIKSGRTVHPDYLKGINAALRTKLSVKNSIVVYDGSESQKRNSVSIYSLKDYSTYLSGMPQNG